MRLVSEIVEIEIGEGAAAVDRPVEEVRVPESARVISVVRDGLARIALRELRLQAGDQVIAILEPGGEDALRRALVEGSRPLFPPVSTRPRRGRRPAREGHPAREISLIRLCPSS